MGESPAKRIKMIIRDHFQNFKSYNLPKAQLIIADVPYNLGNNAYASNPAWYKDGDNKNGESDKAGKSFFDTDIDFRPAEFMHFCSTMLMPEPKRKKEAPCMILFCEFEQQFYFIELAKRYDNGQCGVCGGIIYHGARDNYGSGGAPTFSTCITPTQGYSIHT